MANNANHPQVDPFTTALLTIKALTETYILPTLPPPLSTVLQTTLSTTTTITPYLASTYTTFARLTSNFLSSNQQSSSSSTSRSSFTTSQSNNLINSPESTAFLTTLILIVSIYFTFKILNYVRRTIISWIMFFFRIGMFLVLVQVGWYVHMYGWEKFVRDVSWWTGMLWGLMEEVVDGSGNNASAAEGNRNGGRVPRGMRSRADARRHNGHAYGGGQQVPMGGGRTRW